MKVNKLKLTQVEFTGAEKENEFGFQAISTQNSSYVLRQCGSAERLVIVIAKFSSQEISKD